MSPAFWKNKKVFLTGHTGFKGGWLSLWLQELGADLTGYALDAPTQPSLFERANVGQGMRSIIGDVRDLDTLKAAMLDAQPEIVIHMAAQPLVRYSYINPVETYSTNVMGTVNLFEAIRATDSVRAVVNVTTDKCYENKEWIWGYRENEPMGGHDPYSNSKGCSELVTSAYRASYFNDANTPVALASARAGNVIGGGDWAQDRLIPDMVAAFQAKQPVVIRNPAAIRPWQHVLEPLRGYLTLAEQLYEHGRDYAQAWNFGPYEQDAMPVSWIVEQLCQRWGDDANWVLDKSEQPHEANFLKLEISKASHYLNWKPVLRLDNALQMIVEWNRLTQKNADFRAVTCAQISQYQTLTLGAVVD
jgi:CDP-glucose 4,6-dehydratase